MTTNDLAAIRARAEAATPGEWWVMPDYEDPVLYVETTSHGGYFVCGLDDNRPDDAAFIAAARTDIPNLCDEVEVLRGELARARAERDILKPVVQAYASGFRHSRLANDALNMVNDDAAVAAYMRDAGRGEVE